MKNILSPHRSPGFRSRKTVPEEPVKNQAPAQKSGLMQAERGTSADVSVPISWAFHDIDSTKPHTRFRLYLRMTGLFHQLHCPKRGTSGVDF